jgi:hypothetical protein
MTLFLRLARSLFSEPTVSAVFVPALADFQAELRAAGTRRLARLAVSARWGWALATLVLITPFSVSIPSITDRAPLTRTANGGWFFAVLYASLFAGAWWCVQEFMVAALVAGLLLALALRAWNDQHPASVVLPAPPGGTPLVQINLAKIPVTGDAAGLMFAGGTVLIVVVGLPGLWPYFAATGLASVLLAVALVRSGMSLSGRPAARIALR